MTQGTSSGGQGRVRRRANNSPAFAAPKRRTYVLVGAKATRLSSPGFGRFMERAVRLDDRRPQARPVLEGETQPSRVLTNTALGNAVDDPPPHLRPEPVYRQAELDREVTRLDGGLIAIDFDNAREWVCRHTSDSRRRI